MVSKTILALLAAYAAGVAGSPTGVPQDVPQDRTIEELLAMDSNLIQGDVVTFSATESVSSTSPIICIYTPPKNDS